MTSVLVVDDQALVRAGIVKILQAHDGITVLGEADSGATALDMVDQLVPDVVLMDIRMPDLDGISATSRIVTATAGRVRVLVLTTFGTEDYVADALRAGASGFLLKDAPPEKLVEAIRVVARGDALLDPGVTRAVIADAVRVGRSRRTPSPRLRALTERETDVLRLVARGLSNTEIAERLVLSEATVKTHIGHLFTKLHVRNRVAAVIFAYDNQIVAANDA